MTQRARIRYSRRGGRINADFIDNAAGVATSDREVNLKILLSLAEDDGRIDRPGRDRLLAAVSADVASEVLRQVDHSVAALSRAVPESAADLAAYAALIEVLEQRAQLDRSVEALPDAEEIERRAGAGAGLIRPELAVLLAYAKTDLVACIEASALADEPSLDELVKEYFPLLVRDRAGDLIGRHRLYRELAATGLAGTIVDQMGIKWAHETSAELGCALPDVAGCWWAAWQVLGAAQPLAELEAASAQLAADAEASIHATVAAAVIGVARSYLMGDASVPPSTRIARDRPVADELEAATGGSGPGRSGPGTSGTASSGTGGAGTGGPAESSGQVEERLVARVARWAARAGVVSVADVQRSTGRPLGDVTAALGIIDGQAGVADLTQRIRALAPKSRWGRWQARALLDDLEAYRREAVTVALVGAPGEPPADALRAWLVGQAGAVARSRQARHDLVAAGQAGSPDAELLALASLAVRFLIRGIGRRPGIEL